MALSDDQLAEVEKLLDQSGFLPLTPKAIRLFDEAERLLPSGSAEGSEIARLRSLMSEGGYLPYSRAKALLGQVRSLRNGKAASTR